MQDQARGLFRAQQHFSQFPANIAFAQEGVFAVDIEYEFGVVRDTVIGAVLCPCAS